MRGDHIRVSYIVKIQDISGAMEKRKQCPIIFVLVFKIHSIVFTNPNLEKWDRHYNL